MPRLINVTDEGRTTIGLRESTKVDAVADAVAWVRDVCLIFEQMAGNGSSLRTAVS